MKRRQSTQEVTNNKPTTTTRRRKSEAVFKEVLIDKSVKSTTKVINEQLYECHELLDPSLTPCQMPGREIEYLQIYSTLKDSIENGGGHCLYISGY